MLYGPKSSGAGHPHQLFSARWFVGKQQVSSSLSVVLEQLPLAALTRWWSSSGAERARCPKNLKQKDFTLSETGKHPVILQTVSLVVCLVYGIRKIFRFRYALNGQNLQNKFNLFTVSWHKLFVWNKQVSSK